MILCAGGKKKDICTGDSGGPLMLSNIFNIQRYVVGIVSVGPAECGRDNTTSAYTSVYYYKDWIIQNLKV